MNIAKLTAVPEDFLRKKGVKNPKIIIWGVTAVVSGVLIYLVYRSVKRAIQGTPKFDAVSMADALDKVKVSSTSLTISNGEAIIISQNLLQAMNRYGTDEDAIFAALDQLQTKDDLLLVIKTFGIKLYEGFGLAVDWFSRNFLATPKDLQGWLRAELSGSALTRVKDKFDELGVTF